MRLINLLLIEPLWNWNLFVSFDHGLHRDTFNRTIVELKLENEWSEETLRAPFNRTIVELKLWLFPWNI